MSSFLRRLRAEVAAVLDPIGSDHRERDVVPDAGGSLRIEQVPGGRHEEVQHRPFVAQGDSITSTTTCAPARASANPSPVMASTPERRDAATTSWPLARRTLASSRADVAAATHDDDPHSCTSEAAERCRSLETSMLAGPRRRYRAGGPCLHSIGAGVARPRSSQVADRSRWREDHVGGPCSPQCNAWISIRCGRDMAGLG